MTYLRIAILLAVLAALAGIVVGVHHWDAGRLQRSYDAGVAHERGEWMAKQAEADILATQNAAAATRASEGAADTARTAAASQNAAAAVHTQSTVDEITHAYATTPSPVCRPDGRPVPLPAGVLDALGKARAAALGHP